MEPKVTIYSKDYCPYCIRAKEFFAERNIAYREVDVTADPGKLEELKALTKHMTVPQIFIDNEFVGGYTDMIAKVKSGELKL